jgi:hypothetical protein
VEAVARRDAIRDAWEAEGSPLLATGSTGQLVEHPYVKMLRDHDLLVDRLAAAVRKRHRGFGAVGGAEAVAGGEAASGQVTAPAGRLSRTPVALPGERGMRLEGRRRQGRTRTRPSGRRGGLCRRRYCLSSRRTQVRARVKVGRLPSVDLREVDCDFNRHRSNLPSLAYLERVSG